MQQFLHTGCLSGSIPVIPQLFTVSHPVQHLRPFPVHFGTTSAVPQTLDLRYRKYSYNFWLNVYDANLFLRDQNSPSIKCTLYYRIFLFYSFLFCLVIGKMICSFLLSPQNSKNTKGRAIHSCVCFAIGFSGIYPFLLDTKQKCCPKKRARVEALYKICNKLKI